MNTPGKRPGEDGYRGDPGRQDRLFYFELSAISRQQETILSSLKKHSSFPRKREPMILTMIRFFC